MQSLDSTILENDIAIGGLKKSMKQAEERCTKSCGCAGPSDSAEFDYRQAEVVEVSVRLEDSCKLAGEYKSKLQVQHNELQVRVLCFV